MVEHYILELKNIMDGIAYGNDMTYYGAVGVSLAITLWGMNQSSEKNKVEITSEHKSKLLQIVLVSAVILYMINNHETVIPAAVNFYQSVMENR